MLQPNNQRGHTLIEMLIVLIVITLLTQITLVSFKNFSGINNDRDLINLLSNDLMYAQFWARTHEEMVMVAINPDQHYYVIYHGYSSILKKVNYAKDVKFESGSLGLTISYNINGNIMYSGSIYMRTPRDKYKFVFNLGGGRFYVTKL